MCDTTQSHIISCAAVVVPELVDLITILQVVFGVTKYSWRSSITNNRVYYKLIPCHMLIPCRRLAICPQHVGGNFPDSTKGEVIEAVCDGFVHVCRMAVDGDGPARLVLVIPGDWVVYRCGSNSPHFRAEESRENASAWEVTAVCDHDRGYGHSLFIGGIVEVFIPIWCDSCMSECQQGREEGSAELSFIRAGGLPGSDRYETTRVALTPLCVRA